VEDSVRALAALIRDTEPFPDAVVEKLPPRGDAFVSWPQYAQRLLLHHRGYSWRVTHLAPNGDGWAVAGELTLGDETYGAVGEDNTPTSAESNAFKRACAHAGIGLHLYQNYWLHERLKREDT
jgi:hypothetical protein